MSITLTETHSHLFELIGAGLGAKSATQADYSNTGNTAVVSLEAAELIAMHCDRIRDNRWTPEYANALSSGAAIIVGCLLRNKEADSWAERALMAKIAGII